MAAASQAFVQRIAQYSKRKELSAVRGDYIDPETGEIVDIEAVRAADGHFPEPWPHFRQELQARLSDEPASGLKGLLGYSTEELDEIVAVRVSRAPTRRGFGAAHVGYGRDYALIDAIRERLEAFGGNGKKAFGPDQPPLYKPSRPGRTSPPIRSVQLLRVQKSGIPVRGGVAKHSNMLRIDVFTKGGKYFPVPIYVSDVVKSELPNRAVVANKPESEWTLMDESYQFLWSLHQNDWVRVKKGEVREGYFSGLDISTGAISIWAHDRDPRRTKNGQWTGVGIKTARSFQKFHVDFLGGLHLAKPEQRQPLSRKHKSG